MCLDDDAVHDNARGHVWKKRPRPPVTFSMVMIKKSRSLMTWQSDATMSRNLGTTRWIGLCHFQHGPLHRLTLGCVDVAQVGTTAPDANALNDIAARRIDVRQTCGCALWNAIAMLLKNME